MTQTLILMRSFNCNRHTLNKLEVDQVVSVAQQMTQAGIKPSLILHSSNAGDSQAASTLAKWNDAKAEQNSNLNSHSFRIVETLEKSKNVGTILMVGAEADVESAMSCLVNYPVRIHTNRALAFVMENAKNPSSQRNWRVAKEFCFLPAVR